MNETAGKVSMGGLTMPRNAPPAFHILAKRTRAICGRSGL